MSNEPRIFTVKLLADFCHFIPRHSLLRGFPTSASGRLDEHWYWNLRWVTPDGMNGTATVVQSAVKNPNDLGETIDVSIFEMTLAEAARAKPQRGCVTCKKSASSAASSGPPTVIRGVGVPSRPKSE